MCSKEFVKILLYFTSLVGFGIPIYLVISKYDSIDCSEIKYSLISSISVYSLFFINISILNCFCLSIRKILDWLIMVFFIILSSYNIFIYYKINHLCNNEYFNNLDIIIYWSYMTFLGLLCFNTILYIINHIFIIRKRNKYNLYTKYNDDYDELLS